MKTKTFLGLLSLLLLIAACKKERSCECVSTGTFSNSDGSPVYYMPGYIDSTATTKTYEKIKKRTLEKSCRSTERTVTTTYTTGNGTVVQTQIAKTECTIN